MLYPPGASEFNRVRQASTGCLYLFKMQGAGNRAFPRADQYRLGRRWSAVRICPPRPMESSRYGHQTRTGAKWCGVVVNRILTGNGLR